MSESFDTLTTLPGACGDPRRAMVDRAVFLHEQEVLRRFQTMRVQGEVALVAAPAAHAIEEESVGVVPMPRPEGQ